METTHLCLPNKSGWADCYYYYEIESSCFFTHDYLHIDVISREFYDFATTPLIGKYQKKLLFACILDISSNMFAHTNFTRLFRFRSTDPMNL